MLKNVQKINSIFTKKSRDNFFRKSLKRRAFRLYLVMFMVLAGALFTAILPVYAGSRTLNLTEPSELENPNPEESTSESNSEESTSENPSSESSDLEKPSLPEFYFRAINPGYTVDKVSNVGEMIVLSRLDPKSPPLSLANLSLNYVNSSGNESVLFTFPDDAVLSGETLILRLSSAPESENAHFQYSKTLAFKGGPLTLKRGDEILDTVCWTGKDECEKEFKSASPTVLQRDLETGKFNSVALADFEELKWEKEAVSFEDANTDAEDPPLETSAEEKPAAKCRGVIFSEILSYYDTSYDEQFVEFYNPTSEQIFLDGCQLKYKNKLYPLEGLLVAEGYVARFATDFRLTKNPTNSNLLELVDADGQVIDSLEYPNGQRKGTAYAFIGYDEAGEELWRTTYAPTPGMPNHYQEYKTCEAGKVINEVTGNCVKITSVGEKICGEGKVLNLLTGRCKNAETATSEKTCAEGYYLNPLTNRCKKIQENNGATYELAAPETYTETSTFTAIYAVVGVIGAGLVYVIYEFRHEIVKLWRRLLKKQ